MTNAPSIEALTGREDLDWGTLSGLAAHPTDPARLYAVTDKGSPPARIVEIDVGARPAAVTGVIEITGLDGGDLDLEGVAAAADGGFWLASERFSGAKPDLILEAAADGRIKRSFTLPPSISARMTSKGIEGVTPHDLAAVVVAFQVPISGDPANHARIGRLEPATGAWTFFLYPLEPPSAGEGGKIGLSEILHLGDDRFAVIERDGRTGAAAFKWICDFSLKGMTGAPPEASPPVVAKTRRLDLTALFTALGRPVEPEIEGLAAAADQVYAITDNDARRETLLIRLGERRAIFPGG